jgi:hypothetical protein
MHALIRVYLTSCIPTRSSLWAAMDAYDCLLSIYQCQNQMHHTPPLRHRAAERTVFCPLGMHLCSVRSKGLKWLGCLSRCRASAFCRTRGGSMWR